MVKNSCSFVVAPTRCSGKCIFYGWLRVLNFEGITYMFALASERAGEEGGGSGGDEEEVGEVDKDVVGEEVGEEVEEIEEEGEEEDDEEGEEEDDEEEEEEVGAGVVVARSKNFFRHSANRFEEDNHATWLKRK